MLPFLANKDVYTNIHYVSEHCWKGFQGRGQRSRPRSWPDKLAYNGGGIHFVGVASRLMLSILKPLTFSHVMMFSCVILYVHVSLLAYW